MSVDRGTAAGGGGVNQAAEPFQRATKSAPRDDAARGEEVVFAAARGVVAAMAMSGMRTVTSELGIVDQTPPEAIVSQRAKGLVRRVPRSRRRPAVEVMHWAYGGVGGAGFGLLPAGLRRQAWAGPAYGLATWLGFELVLAPALGLAQAGGKRPQERLALAADHLLYGLVLSEFRRKPQER